MYLHQYTLVYMLQQGYQPNMITCNSVKKPTRFRAQSGDGVLQCEAWRRGGQHSTISGGAGSRGMPAAKTMLKMKN